MKERKETHQLVLFRFRDSIQDTHHQILYSLPSVLTPLVEVARPVNLVEEAFVRKFSVERARTVVGIVEGCDRLEDEGLRHVGEMSCYCSPRDSQHC